MPEELTMPNAPSSSSAGEAARPSLDLDQEIKKIADPDKKRESRQKSPEEILSLITPPTCYIGLSRQDHRWTSTNPWEGSKFTGKLKQTRFSSSFAQRVCWQDALRNVHEFNWRKWRIVKEAHPLPEGRTGGAGTRQSP